jgi:hypothetical protein
LRGAGLRTGLGGRLGRPCGCLRGLGRPLLVEADDLGEVLGGEAVGTTDPGVRYQAPSRSSWTNNQVLRVMLNTIGGPTNGAKRNDSIGYGIVRPRIALQNPGDPGPADVYPLPDFSAASSASPSPGTAGSGSKDPASQAKDDKTAAEVSSDKGGAATLWVALGIGAAVLIGGVVAAIATGKRHREA